MTAPALKVIRRPERFQSNDRRVIARFFTPHEEHRIRAIIRRVRKLDPNAVHRLLDQVQRDFAKRHKDLRTAMLRHFEMVRSYIDDPEVLSEESKLLIGAYFTMEYSFESAALFNPSIVRHPNQSDLRPGELRFIMSLRATGEGHISSIVFRTGVTRQHNGKREISFDEASPFSSPARVIADRRFDRHLFYLKLIEMGAFSDNVSLVFEHLDEHFTLRQLQEAVEKALANEASPANLYETTENMMWLARSNYHLEMPPNADPSEIVIYPTSENESKGLEDLRLVRFVDDDGSVRYFGTYTAYNGYRILPQLLETDDFKRVEVHTLNGRYVQNKGMALFPRKIDGWYTMISRLDGENMYIMRSDQVHFWNECMPLQAPRYPWEFVQIGNCGSPIETPRGWLLLTHGVGPVRQYCIGASLLDLNDPSRVIGHLDEPLIVPEEDERDGYVPNVVYSCGAIAHGDDLIIPYAISDIAVRFAQCSLSELLDHLTERGAIDYDP